MIPANISITVSEGIEKGYCTELIEGKLKWIVEKDTGKKLISTPIGTDFKEKLLVSPLGKIIGFFD